MTEFLEYSEARHAYYADGSERISVTQVLDRCGLISDFCRNEEASRRGSEVHRLCALDDLVAKEMIFDLRKVPKVYRGYLKAWRQFRKDAGFTPTLIEYRVDCPELGYAGRLDRATTDTVLDIKTSVQGSIQDYVRYQLTAYAHALQPNKIFKRLAVALMPDGRYKTKTFDAADFLADRARWFELVRQAKGGK